MQYGRACFALPNLDAIPWVPNINPCAFRWVQLSQMAGLQLHLGVNTNLVLLNVSTLEGTLIL